MTDRNAGPGARLRAERERLGVTVREVSETLNLTMGVVEAIEADDYGRLPGPVFSRGYLRAYARLLRVDPEPLLDGCPYAAGDVAPVPARTEPPLREWVRRRPVLVLGSAGAAAAALLIAALLLLWPVPDPQPPAAVSQGPTAPAALDPRAAVDAGVPVAPADAGSVPLAAEQAVQALAVDEQTIGGSQTIGSTLPAGEPPVSEVAAEAAPALEAEPLLMAGDARQRITPDGDDRLGLAFSDDCWVEVRDSEGRRLYSNLSRGGSELTLVGQGPFRVLLGYAPGASLRFNDEPVPIEPHTRNNVASLVLGH
ncbi:MAG: DUF4115 domain-containing protein [Pseudomonadales bacterium]